MRGVCAGLPDKRRGRNVHYAMADIGMAAFSVFFMQSPSFLAQQRRLLEGCGRSNCQTLFEMAEIPSDNHIRAMLDPVSPGAFQPVFDATIRTLEAGDGLAPFRRLGDHVLIALDGTEYHRSAKVHCPRCSIISKGGQIEYFHAMVSAALVAPGHTRVLPLEPEFVEPRRNREAGLRKSRLSALARRPWCNLRAPQTCLSRRRFVFLPADLRGSTPSQRELPIRLQTGLPPDADGISFRRRTVRARRDAQAWESALSLYLQMAVRPAPARRQGRHARQLALDRDRRPEGQGHLPQQLRHRPAGGSQHYRRTRRLRPCQMEGREREL